MKQLKCENCGAPLTVDGRCEYCGAVYVIEQCPGGVLLLETRHPQAEAFAAEVRLDRRLLAELGREPVLKMAEKEVSHKLTEALSPYVKLSEMEDPLTGGTLLRGTIRVVKPGHRF